MIELEQYWQKSSNENWIDFVKLCKEFWNNSPLQLELLELLKDDKEIAIVVNYRFGNDSLNWVKSKIQVLDNLAPIECLDVEELKRRLKLALLRMH